VVAVEGVVVRVLESTVVMAAAVATVPLCEDGRDPDLYIHVRGWPPRNMEENGVQQQIKLV
jgi:hypothetical protein